MKKCSNCKEEKRFIEFTKDKTRKDGYYHRCKSCRKKYDKKYYEENKDKLSEHKKKYRQENKENISKQQKQYQKENKERRNEYQNKRKQKDPLYRLRCNISISIYKSMKNKGYTKRSQTYKILGCSYEDFKLHIERQFKDGMSWENAGKWHYDHIYPISLAKNYEELIKLNHYTNFQPLWAIDNIKKGNKTL